MGRIFRAGQGFQKTKGLAQRREDAKKKFRTSNSVRLESLTYMLPLCSLRLGERNLVRLENVTYGVALGIDGANRGTDNETLTEFSSLVPKDCPIDGRA